MKRSEQSSKFILMASGAEYSMDYNFFAEHQLMVTKNRTGTQFIGRLDGVVFLRTERREIHENLTSELSRLVHASLCKLDYGGEVTD